MNNTETSKMLVSYLHARDPSILISKNYPKPCKLDNLMEETVSNEESNGKKSKQIEVFLRIKSGDENEIYSHKDDVLECKIPTFSQFSKNLKPGTQMLKKYSFSQIFSNDASQSEIFHNVVKERVLNFINGSSSTLFAYGSSGSGKTYTMLGTEEQPGVIPRTLEYLFKTLPKLNNVPNIKVMSNNKFKRITDLEGKKERTLLSNLLNKSALLTKWQSHIKTYNIMQKRLTNEPPAILDKYEGIDFGIWISFAEIYNENIYDLLEHKVGSERPKLKLCNNNGETFIRNLKQVYVASALEAYQILQFGLLNINYASTCINSHSSRSHCIFTIKLVQAPQFEDDVRISQFNFCDLAGSERTSKTNNVGKRLNESNNINTSLMILSRCITTIRNSQKSTDKLRVPYRESKLTQLFQKALSGQEEIGIIININPILAMIDETIHVLNFSIVAKDILIETPIEKEYKKIKRASFSAYNFGRSTEVPNNNKSPEEYQKTIEDLNNVVDELYSNIEKLEQEIVVMEKEHAMEMYKQISTVTRELDQKMRLEIKKYEEREKENLKEIRRLQLKCFKANIEIFDENSQDTSNTLGVSPDELSMEEDEDLESESSNETFISNGNNTNHAVSRQLQVTLISDDSSDSDDGSIICLDSSNDLNNSC